MYASLHKKTTRINYIKSHLYYKHIMYAVLDLINVCEFLFLQKYGLYFTDIEPCFFFIIISSARTYTLTNFTTWILSWKNPRSAFSNSSSQVGFPVRYRNLFCG